MKLWLNFVGYEAVWFCAVIAAAYGLVWPGPLAFVLFAACQVGLATQRRVQLQLMVVAITCGMVIDGLLAASGWIDYAARGPALPPGGAPLWILALWGAFALTLTESLRYLQKNLWIACLFGAIGGPLAYWFAARAWGVVRFAEPSWHAWLALAVGWGLAMPLLAGMARHGSAHPTTPLLHWSQS